MKFVSETLDQVSSKGIFVWHPVLVYEMHISFTTGHRSRVFIYSTTNQPTPRKRYPQRVHKKCFSRLTLHCTQLISRLSVVQYQSPAKKIITLHKTHLPRAVPGRYNLP